MSETEKTGAVGVTSDALKKPGDLPTSTTQTHLAWLRTRMTVETTMASWVRTATSLIGFGFAIVQFFQHFADSSGQLLSRYVGLVLLGIGTIATGVAIWQYRIFVKYLKSDAFQGYTSMPSTGHIYPVIVVAVLLFLGGLLAFIVILVWGKVPWA